MKSFLILIIAVVCIPNSLLAQEEKKTIDPTRQFDFWVGEWDIYTEENLVGKNTIVLLQNKNVIQENWISDKENFTGTSYSFYNPKTAKWHQIWIDKNGNNLLLEGAFSDGKMVLSSGLNSNMGEPNSLHRITWTQLTNGNVKQVWELTTDNGKSWNIQFQGVYKKSKP